MAISLATLTDQVSKLEVAAAAAVALLKEDGTGVSQADVDAITDRLKAVTDSLSLTPATPPAQSP